MANLTAFALQSRRVIAVRGPDTRKFLQGLITNDIQPIANSASSALYTAFLSHKGRVLFDAILHGQPEEDVLMDVNESVVDSAMQHLTKYKLRSKIFFQDESDQYTVLSFMSPFPGLLYDLQQTFLNSDFSIKSCVFDPRVHCMGLRVIIPTSIKKDILHILQSNFPSLAIEDQEMYENQRFWLGIPESPKELIFQKSLPLESNIQWLNGISYVKGCYLGQELTARTHYKGVVRKRIVPVILTSEEIQPVSKNLPLSPYLPALCSTDATLSSDSVLAIRSKLQSKENDSEELNYGIKLVLKESGEEIGKLLSLSPSSNIAIALMKMDAILQRQTPQVLGTGFSPTVYSFPIIPGWWPFDDK